MRRKDREISDFNGIVEIVDECDIVRIGLADGDYPYIVPVNFGYTAENGQLCLYFHGAMAGRKYELINRNPRCSFEMDVAVEMDCIPEAKDVTMRYKSVMGIGEVELLEGEEKQAAIDEVLMGRYEATRDFKYNPAVVAKTAVFKLTATEVTGKINPVRTK